VRTTSQRVDRVSRLIALALVLITLAIFSPAFAHFYTDYLWFAEMGMARVFTTRMMASVGMASVGALIAAGMLWLNWTFLPHIFTRSHILSDWLPSPTLRFGRGKIRLDGARPPRAIHLLTGIAAVVVGVLLGLSLRDHWTTFLLARFSQPFGLEDPIFGLDVSFYVFTLPWYRVLLSWAEFVVGLSLAGAALRYALLSQLTVRGATAHLSLLGSFWLILVGIGRLFARYVLLVTQRGLVFGVGYTDFHARIPLYTVEAGLFFLAALVLVVNLFVRQARLLVGIGLFWLGLSLIAPLYPAFVQQFTVEPNEFILEKPYIEHHITFTQRAYELDRVVESLYPATGEITPEQLADNADVLNNVRLWDYRPLKRTFGQLQEIRLYYAFEDVDVDRYALEDGLTEVALAVRELDVDELASQAQTWINRHLIFTHGYGLALSSVNGVTPEGLPKLLVHDIPPVSEDPALELRRPEIYFGERTDQYVVVNAAEDEFDYPRGDTNAYTRYEGGAGVPLGGMLKRALFAVRFGSTQLLLSPALSNDSRILFHRSVVDRVKTLAPMLLYDRDPYAAVVNGRIVWLLDAYTSTENFPYAQPVDGAINYLRNSVKVTIDAYTGEVRLYLIDKDDPIAATYARIFPDLFTDSSEIPHEIQAHWRYPEMLFLYQSYLYATYHMRDPQVFYNREDLWGIPQELVETEQRTMEPYYVTMRLPGSDRLEFLLMRPYVPHQKQNMVAWLYARCDGDVYGELGVFKLSKDRLVYGPLQIEGRVDQDPVISQQLSLWNQRGSRVLRGNLLVIPLAGTFLYVEPLYLEAEAGQLPELKRVIVAYSDQVTMASTLRAALEQAIGTIPTGGVAGEESGDEGATLEELAARAWRYYEQAQACLAQGDWACYGEQQALLESVLRQMVGDVR